MTTTPPPPELTEEQLDSWIASASECSPTAEVPLLEYRDFLAVLRMARRVKELERELQIQVRKSELLVAFAPKPEELAQCQETLYATESRATQAERERDELRAEVERLRRIVADPLKYAPDCPPDEPDDVEPLL